MDENRKEKRNPEKLQLLLSSAVDPLLIETAVTENVSFRGLRVRTQRSWERDSFLTVLCSESGLWARGRVAYCQALSDDTFAIGLELLAQTGATIAR